MKRFITMSITILPFLAQAGGEATFQPLFDSVVENRLYPTILRDAPGDWLFQLDTASTNQMCQALAALSNHVDEAVAMLPTVLTNDVRREVFFKMSGYAGTNVLFQVWNGLLEIAETNAVLCPATYVEWFWDAPTTPLEDYVLFRYDLPISQSLLARTRNLFSSGSDSYRFLNGVLSGDERSRKIEFLTDSGETLPPFLRDNE